MGDTAAGSEPVGPPSDWREIVSAGTVEPVPVVSPVIVAVISGIELTMACGLAGA